MIPIQQFSSELFWNHGSVFMKTAVDMDNTLSSYEIAEKTGYAPSTIQRYMKDWKMRHTEAVHEATPTAS